MKTLAPILAATFLICGCNQKMPDKWESGIIEWNQSLFPKQELSITTGIGQVKAEIFLPDQALNLLGQYGWELVIVTSENGKEVFYLKRHPQKYGGFTMTPN
jgi:hypothetical protein